MYTVQAYAPAPSKSSLENYHTNFIRLRDFVMTSHYDIHRAPRRLLRFESRAGLVTWFVNTRRVISSLSHPLPVASIWWHESNFVDFYSVCPKISSQNHVTWNRHVQIVSSQSVWRVPPAKAITWDAKSSSSAVTDFFCYRRHREAPRCDVNRDWLRKRFRNKLGDGLSSILFKTNKCR
jgi:hypothetical protein